MIQWVTPLLSSSHPETNVFGLALSAISFRLSAKDIKNKALADCRSLTACPVKLQTISLGLKAPSGNWSFRMDIT